MNSKYFDGIFLSILDYICMLHHEEDIGMQVHFEKHINFYQKEILDIKIMITEMQNIFSGTNL